MSSMYSDLKQFKRTFTEFKGTTANMESFRSEVEQTATNIGLAIYDALGEIGVKIKGKDRSVNIKAGVFKVEDRKSTRLNSSHANISYAVFCLKKKKSISTHYSHIYVINF